MTNMTETNSDITRDDRDERDGVGTDTNNDDITRGITNGYEDITRDDRDEIVITNDYEDITKGYEDITKGYNEENEENGTIGLD